MELAFTSGLCPAHDAARAERREASQQRRQKAADERRGSARERGYDSKWDKARAGFLVKNPLCAACEKVGRTTAAKVVDHIVPHRGDMVLFWKRENWQPLCEPHHSEKTMRELAGSAGWSRKC